MAAMQHGALPQDKDSWSLPAEDGLPEREEEVDQDSWDEGAVQHLTNPGCSFRLMGAPQQMPRSAPRRSGGGLARLLGSAGAMLSAPLAAVASAAPKLAASKRATGFPEMAGCPAIPCPPPAPKPMMAAMPCAAVAPGGQSAACGAAIGFRTGGAQDVSNFRENIKAGYLPLPSDLTYEGVVKDYYFDMASPEEEPGEPCTDLFFPTYSLALVHDPLLSEPPAGTAQPTCGAPAAPAGAATHATPPDVFLSVGLDSGLTDFQRPHLNLMILLDVSGSMDASFNSYYYDAAGQRRELSREELQQTKLDVAKEVVLGMVGRLGQEDSFGIALFASEACVPKQLGPMRTAKLDSIKAGVRALRTAGCTNLQAGMDACAAQFQGYSGFKAADPATTESRLVIITDAEPNAGDFSSVGLQARLKASALDGVHTTFIGVGLDFNSTLVEEISAVKGCNYFSVHSPGEFEKRLCEDFDCMVSPLVFDLALHVDPASMASGWRILHCYGSPNPQDNTLLEEGTLMKVHTLFPSPKTEEGVKGGVLLLRMRPPPLAASSTAGCQLAPLRLAASYCDRSGRAFASSKEVALPEGALLEGASPGAGHVFQSSGVRKAVLLSRLVDALQSWLVDERTPESQPCEADADYLERFCACPNRQAWLGCGQRLVPPPPGPALLGRWERTSRPLSVSPRAKAALGVLLRHVRSEMAALGDAVMAQEVELLERLVGSGGQR